MRWAVSIFALAMMVGCEDSDLVARIGELDQTLADRQTEAQLLLARERDLSGGPGAPAADPLGSGTYEDIKTYLQSLAVAEAVEVRGDAQGVEILLRGSRGRRQAAQSLIRFGVEAPTLELTGLETKVDDWRMTLAVPRVADGPSTMETPPPPDVPTPSFLSFSDGQVLYARASKKREEIVRLDHVIAEMKLRKAHRQRRAAAMGDTARLERARQRRHFAILLLPSVRDGGLSFADGRATWKGEAGFEDLEDARTILAARGNVIGFAPGKQGSLTVELR